MKNYFNLFFYFAEMLKKASEDTSYDDYIKRINDLKKDNEDEDNNKLN